MSEEHPKNKIFDEYIEQFNEIVLIGGKLSKAASSANDSLGHDSIQELHLIANRGGQLIERLYGQDSHIYKSLQQVLKTQHFNMMHSNYHAHVDELVGILKTVQHELKAGLLYDIRSLVTADVFSDFLEMAEYLLRENYKDASAVILGAVLEDSLRSLAIRKKIPIQKDDGKPLMIDALNNELEKTGVYGRFDKMQITTWAHLRNNAAHGHYDKYDIEQVKMMLFFVKKFCADYLK